MGKADTISRNFTRIILNKQHVQSLANLEISTQFQLIFLQ